MVSIMEHHSNIVPWQQAAKRTGAVLKYVECTEGGKIGVKGAGKCADRTDKNRICHADVQCSGMCQ